MLTRRFRYTFARLCVALLCLQAAVAAYACPGFVAEVKAAAAIVENAAAGDCQEHVNAGNSAQTTACHQHYAGDQSVGTASLASAASASTMPLAIVPLLEPAVAARSSLPILLQRSTAPPLAIRFQVLRI